MTNASPSGWSELTEVEAWSATSPPPTNVALAANGATASASSSYPGGYGASGANNGGRKGDSAGDYWNDAAPANTFNDDWLQVEFNGTKTIGEIDVFTAQDNWQNPSEPTESMTFTLYGLTAFDVQYWNGSSWVTVPNGNITNYNKVWRKITFSPITTSKIRVVGNAAPDGYSRITELEAWTAASGGGGSSANIHWLVADHLGTPRMVFDQTGSLASVSRHDYLPFGEELFGGPPSQPGVGGRTTTMGYTSSDNVRQRFTSKERDNETGLDYFLARFYSSNQGRFTSPDEFSGGPDELFDFADHASENPTFYAELDNPQSLNKYQYTYNNPINLTDEDGHCPPCGGLAYKKAYDKIKENPSAALDIVQGVITAVGFVPAVGDAADLFNAGISLARGNLGDAAADLTGAVPVVGSVVPAANRGRKLLKLLNKSEDAVDSGNATRKINVEVRHSSRKEAKEAAEHPNPGKKMPTPPKSDTKKRKQYEEQQKYRNPERHPNSKSLRSHFHEKDKSKNRKANIHHTYPE